MNIHLALAAHRLHAFAAGLPAILVGDFNIKPCDSAYKLITTGTLPDDDPERPVPPVGDSWAPFPLPLRLRSAYHTALGAEPEFTNYAITCWNGKLGDPFINTLDYIFLSDHWKVESCLPLPKVEGFPGPLPTEAEPSDLIAIGATLRPVVAFTKHTSKPIA